MKNRATSCSRREIEGLVHACCRGSRGNLAAAWAAAWELDDGSRGPVVRRIEKLAAGCPVVPADSPGSFEWLDGSRRARLMVGPMG